MVDLCNFSCVGDCKDRLIRNSIVAGLSSTKAYQQCISKGSNLTLNECIRICQTEDATRRQVQALRPESTDCNDSTPIHHIAELPSSAPQDKLQGQGRIQGAIQRRQIQPQGRHRRAPALERLQAQYRDYMWLLQLMAPQSRRRMQSRRPRVPVLWKIWTLLQSVQTKAELSTE